MTQTAAAASLLAVVSGTDYHPAWVDGSVRNKSSAPTTVGYFTPTYFALYNNTSSTIAATIWTMDTFNATTLAYNGIGVVVNIAAYSTFPVYLGKVTWTGATGDLIALGSLTPITTR